MILTLLLASLLGVAQEKDKAPERDLVDLFGCGGLMKAAPTLPSPAAAMHTVEKATLSADPAKAFDMRNFLGAHFGRRTFLIGWDVPSPLDFKYRVHAHYLHLDFAGAVEAKALKATYERRRRGGDSKTNRVPTGKPVGAIYVHWRNGDSGNYWVREQGDPNTVQFDDQDLSRITKNHANRTAGLEQVTFWIWRPTGGPPTPDEIAMVQALAQFEWRGAAAKPRVSLNIVGDSWGGYSSFEVEIPIVSY